MGGNVGDLGAREVKLGAKVEKWESKGCKCGNCGKGRGVVGCNGGKAREGNRDEIAEKLE